MYSELILGGLWQFGVGGAAWAFMPARIAVSVAAGGVLARETWLWRVRQRRYAAADVFVPYVAVSTDNDGDLYFKCLLWLPDGRVLTVAEGYKRPQIDAAHRRLLAALAARGRARGRTLCTRGSCVAEFLSTPKILLRLAGRRAGLRFLQCCGDAFEGGILTPQFDDMFAAVSLQP